MKARIKEKLQGFLREEYPEVIILFSQRGTLPQYLDDRVELILPLMDELLEHGEDDIEVISRCIAEITSGFGPSKFRYLDMVMAEEFPQEYEQFSKAGVLRFELTNLIVACMAAFDAFDFSHQNIDDHFMRHMIIAEMHDYLLSRSQN